MPGIANLLDLDAETRQVVDHLKKVSSIHVLNEITGGKSKSSVYLVDVDPLQNEAGWRLPHDADYNQLFDTLKDALSQEDLLELVFRLGYPPDNFRQLSLRTGIIDLVDACKRDRRKNELINAFYEVKPHSREPRGVSGLHYLKIHHDDSEAEDLEAVINLNDTVISPHIADHAVYRGRMAVLYKPAQGALDRVETLAYLLENDAESAQKNQAGLARKLLAWNEIHQRSTYAPHELLRKLLGPGSRRYKGYESVQQRMMRLLTTSPAMRAQAPLLVDEPRLEFAGQYLIPNPVAFLEHEEWWAHARDEFKMIRVQEGRVHGDLHAANIMCRHSTGEETHAEPDVIDYATFRNDQVIYFDLAYLEFDILMRLCSPDKPENREQLVKIVKYLTTKDDIELLRSPRLGPLASEVVDLVRPLREIINLFDRNHYEYSELSFWMCAVAVGLNFARKKTVTACENMLGLLYAGSALECVLRILKLPFDAGSSVEITWPVDIDTDTPVPISGLPDAIDQIAHLIEENRNEIVFICSPQDVFFDEAALTDELCKRLTWTDYPTDEDDPWIDDITTLDQALAAYADYMSDFNLREALRAAAVQRNKVAGLPSLVPLLAVFGQFENVSVVTYDWDTALDQRMARWAEANAVGDRVLHLCGSLGDLTGPIHWLERLSQRALDEQEKVAKEKVYDKLLSRLRKAKLIFLGPQPFDHPGWNDVIGRHLHERNTKWNAWLINDQDATNHHDLEYLSITLVEDHPVQFLGQVLEMLCPDCDPFTLPPPLPDPLISPENYKPRIVDQDIQIENILKNQRLQWVLQEEPGVGKSAFLFKMCETHDAQMQYLYRCCRSGTQTASELHDEDMPPFSLIVDFAATERDSSGFIIPSPSGRRKILHLLFDYFHCQIPDLRSDPNHRDFQPDDKVTRLINEFADAPEFTEAGGDYSGFFLDGGDFQRSEVLLCFDSLHLAESHHITRWLCTEFAPILTSRSLEAPEAVRAHFKIVLARRNRPMIGLSHFAQWGFNQAKVKPLTYQDALEMLEDYVKHARIPNVPDSEQAARRDHILKVIRTPHNGETMGQRQAKRYLEVSQGDNYEFTDAYALKALIRAHAERGYPNMGTWPRKNLEAPIQTEVILPAAWDLVENTLRLDPVRQLLRDIYGDIFLARRVCESLLQAIIDASAIDERESLTAIWLKNRLAERGFITTESAHYNGDFGMEDDWFLVSPALHRVIRHGTRLTEQERFKRVSAVIYYYKRDALDTAVADAVWEDMVIGAMYQYEALYEDHALDDGPPDEKLKTDILTRFKMRGFKKPDKLAALQNLYQKAHAARLSQSLLDVIHYMIHDTRALGSR